MFVASFILHMAAALAQERFMARVPDEDKVMDALRPSAISGLATYMLPNCSGSKEAKSPEFAEKAEAAGPVITMTVLENCSMKMGRSLGLWFLYLLAVSYFAGLCNPAWRVRRRRSHRRGVLHPPG